MSRFATLMQVMSSSNAEALANARSAGFVSPTMSSGSVCTTPFKVRCHTVASGR